MEFSKGRSTRALREEQAKLLSPDKTLLDPPITGRNRASGAYTLLYLERYRENGISTSLD